MSIARGELLGIKDANSFGLSKYYESENCK